VIIISSKQNRN